jgi:hypothetical protein
VEPQTKTPAVNQAPEPGDLSNYLQQINNKFRPKEYNKSNKLQEATER